MYIREIGVRCLVGFKVGAFLALTEIGHLHSATNLGHVMCMTGNKPFVNQFALKKIFFMFKSHSVLHFREKQHQREGRGGSHHL